MRSILGKDSWLRAFRFVTFVLCPWSSRLVFFIHPAFPGVHVFPVFFEFRFIVPLLSSIANILSSRSWPGPDLCRVRRYILAELCKDFALPENFFVAELPRFSSFLPRNTLPLLFLSLTKRLQTCGQAFSSLFIRNCFFKHVAQVSFSFCAFFAIFFLPPVRRALCSPQRPLSTFLEVSHFLRRLRSFVLRCFPRFSIPLSRTTFHLSTFHFSPS